MHDRRLAERILQHLRQPSYRPLEPGELRATLCEGPQQRQVFDGTLEALRLRGRVVFDRRRRVLAASPTGTMTGVYRGTSRAFGFCIPDHPTEFGDLFIPPGKHADALTGDHVLVRVSKRGKRAGRMSYEGQVLEVLQRGRSHFVGRLQRSGETWFIVADGGVVPGRILLPDAPASGARLDDQVVVQIIQYPDDTREARGVVLEILGEHGAPGTDVLSILREFEIPDEFPEDCLEQARNAALDYAPGMATGGRQDLRETVILTIDPHDARDFDDAISVERRDDGWTLGVHIADVSHFIPEDSALDVEARRRGNSVYLPGHVVPMLPEVLSNGVCSLQEDVDRLTKSVFIRYDADGQVVEERFCNTVIRSRKRLTYEQAAGTLQGRTGGVSTEICELLQRMEQLARIIQSRRVRHGMISLHLPEVELLLDESGAVRAVQPQDDSYPHTIIEMFMVEANEVVARKLDALGLLALRRVHPDPSADAAKRLGAQLKVLGFKAPRNMQRAALQDLLAAALEGPEAFNVHYAVLRAMEPAAYSPEGIGHYALASEHYLHFTSPIRRYPDLAVHRAVQAVLSGTAEDRQSEDETAYAEWLELGDHCSDTERRAESAERDLRMLKLLQHLQGRLGEDVQGVVTGLIEDGVFVRLDRYLIEGLVRFEDLPQRPWEVFREAFCAVHPPSGRRITFGDVVQVRLVAVDLTARRLQLSLQHQISSRGRGIPQRARPRSRRDRRRR